MAIFGGRQWGIILALLLWPLSGIGAELEPFGRYDWQSPRAEFGGLSGIDVFGDGAGFLAVSDRGFLFEAAIVRTPAGQISDIDLTQRYDLRERDGTVMRKFLRDAEGLAVTSEGGFYVSFESYPRVWFYDTPGAGARATHKWNHFWDLLGNTGLEALTTTAAGGIIAIGEEVSRAGVSKVYQFNGSEWSQPYTIPVTDGFQIAGADEGPDGWLYLVERKLGWRGFSSRIRRFDPGRAGSQEVLLSSQAGELGNTEGISVWVDFSGRIILTLVTDDNFSPLQKTSLVEFILRD